MAIRVLPESGTRGVYRSRDRWRAEITVDGKTKSLGTYETKKEAVLARQAAEKIR